MNSNAKILNTTVFTNRIQRHLRKNIYHDQVELIRMHWRFETHPLIDLNWKRRWRSSWLNLLPICAKNTAKKGWTLFTVKVALNLEGKRWWLRSRTTPEAVLSTTMGGPWRQKQWDARSHQMPKNRREKEGKIDLAANDMKGYLKTHENQNYCKQKIQYGTRI